MSTDALFTTDELFHLPNVLSAPRFSTYLLAQNENRGSALALYRWNLEISAAFLVPLHVLEVVLRNAVSEAIEIMHGDKWPWSAGFIRSLPSPRPPAYSPSSDLQTLSRRHQTSGKIVADLRFVFWEKMLARRHHERLWEAAFRSVFPNVPHDLNVDQARIRLRNDVEDIRILRNRIAHHEPVFARVLSDDLDRVVRVVRWRSRTAADWLSRVESVSTLLLERPKSR